MKSWGDPDASKICIQTCCGARIASTVVRFKKSLKVISSKISKSTIRIFTAAPSAQISSAQSTYESVEIRLGSFVGSYFPWITSVVVLLILPSAIFYLIHRSNKLKK
eukprot:12028124-Karenia_brevis.AAC.1